MASEKGIEHASELDGFHNTHTKRAEYQQRNVATELGTLLAQKVFQAHNLHPHHFNFFLKYIMSDYRLQKASTLWQISINYSM